METRKLSILVGTDFSVGSEIAFGEAIRLALRTGGALEVVHVVPSSVAGSTELFETGGRDIPGLPDARLHLEDYFAYAAVEGVAMGAHVRTGNPVAELLAAIKELDPDLVVVGSRGHGAVVRAFVGSVSDELWRRSTAQVLVIPSSRVAAAPARIAGQRAKKRVAWGCRACGHIFSELESVDRCAACGVKPARWFGAPMDAGPADAGVPAVGHGVGEEEARMTGDAAGTVSVGPPGTSGYDVNPELRVRY